jgi:TBC1 domain family member 10
MANFGTGLTYIAGQLLLQSPEVDAFWILISLMDTHLRPYFAANGVQMEVDASLFAKAVEVADPTMYKRLFVDYSVAPVDIVRPWFSSLFVEALPTEYFQRVWDIFLSEGTSPLSNFLCVTYEL